jgi:hypothetical protein
VKVALLADVLGVPTGASDDSIAAYGTLREYYFEQYFNALRGIYQSPSYWNTSLSQMADMQRGRCGETYLRYDFSPEDRERQFNAGHYALDGVSPETLFFSSGMAAITTLLIHVVKASGTRRACVGRRTYYETIRLLQRLFKVSAQDEYQLQIPGGARVLWIDYPLSTRPNRLPNVSAILRAFADVATRQYESDFYAVVDYTVAAFTFDVREYLCELPENLNVILVTSLQKHMGYGLDLAKGGAITVYSRSPELLTSLRRLRMYAGTLFNETSYYLMPPIYPSTVRQIVADAGVNARDLACGIERLGVEGLILHYPLASPSTCDTSLVFVEMSGQALHQHSSRPYPSDMLLQSILAEAQQSNCPLCHGESFGFPMTRIHKWGTVDSDVPSIRISVGYDDKLALAAKETILRGIVRYAETARI